MEKITIKKNSLGDSRTAARVPSREEFSESNNSHRNDVSNLMNAFADELRERAARHDWTKVEEPYATMFYELLTSAIRGEKDFEEGEWAKLHYCELERHHLTRHCPDDVTLFDVIECICDNVAAGLSRAGYVFPLELPGEILQKAFANTLEYIKTAVEVE